MSISLRLIILQFLQFFIWGAWLITAGNYMYSTLGFSSLEIGGVYAALGVASLFMPSILGIISDKWIPANYLYVVAHLISGIFLYLASTVTRSDSAYTIFYIYMLISLLFYMPTISLSYSICYTMINEANLDPANAFPPIRVWGTIGFIIAMWSIDLLDFKLNAAQFIIAAGASIVLCIFVLGAIPKLPIITATKGTVATLSERLGLSAFKLFKDSRMATFFLFSMLLGVVLQISNSWANQFVDFVGQTGGENNLVSRYSTIIVSISQISEAVFILLVPFFLKRFGIKTIMIISMIAWFLRFGFFGIADSTAMGLTFIFLSMIVYGCAFDFFNISGSIYVEQSVPAQMRNSAQGLFMSLVNGVGGILSGYGSGLVVSYFTNDGVRDWTSIWFCFATYALVLAIVFFFCFKNKKGELDIKSTDIDFKKEEFKINEGI